MKVFIADDSPIFRERLHSMLSEVAGITVIGEAGNVPEAIQSIHALQPDAVILDIRMPGGSGLDVLKHIKEFSSIPVVIMLTNYSDPLYRKTCMALGAEYFFDKSSEFKEARKVCEQLAHS
jgi:DNA-binding NarL/FixJ family response regulator